jgi:hypothetical protein
MKIDFTAEQEALLARIAMTAGTDKERCEKSCAAPA